MDTASLFLGIIPLFVFAIVDSFSGIKSALISAGILAIFEAGISLYYFGTIDIVTGFSVSLVIVLAIISYKTKSPTYFKFQPVALSGTMGLALLIFYWFGKPILYIMMVKYKDQLPIHMKTQIENPIVIALMQLTSHYAGYALLAHAAVVGWAAIKLNNWWWITMRVFAFYLFLFISMVVASIQIRTML